MSAFADLVLFFSFVFLGSYMLSRALCRKKPISAERLGLTPHHVIRLLTSSGNYRCHYVGSDSDSLQISAPLHRDCHVPLRVGETLIVQTASDDSLLTFRSNVVARDAKTHELSLALPTSFRKTDRRCEPRLASVNGQSVRLNDSPAILENLSAWGAKLITSEMVLPGDLVRLRMRPDAAAADGYALESRPMAWDGKLCRQIRIRFEEPLRGL